MRNKILALGLCVVMLLLAASVIAGPEITIPESEFDFGFVPQNAKVSHYFWLHSTGDSLLQITKVLPG